VEKRRLADRLAKKAASTKSRAMCSVYMYEPILPRSALRALRAIYTLSGLRDENNMHVGRDRPGFVDGEFLPIGERPMCMKIGFVLANSQFYLGLICVHSD